MIYTWAADISPLLDEACYKWYYQRTPQFRREKADCLRQPIKKAQSIGVWYLYEQMKHQYRLDGSETYNFSHSENYVVCSVCTGRPDAGKVLTGCDVEIVRTCRMKLAERFFCTSECQYIQKETGEKQKEMFTRLWVLKESFMKATRKGMAMPLRAFEVQPGNPSVLVKQPSEFPETFYYMESELGGGTYRVAVCSTDQDIDTEIRLIQMEC